MGNALYLLPCHAWLLVVMLQTSCQLSLYNGNTCGTRAVPRAFAVATGLGQDSYLPLGGVQAVV